MLTLDFGDFRVQRRVGDFRDCFEVQRRVNAQTATLAMRTLTAFRKATRYQRDIKHHVLAQWKEYAMRLMIVPFRAWYIYASRRRARHRAQNTLVRAFKNKKI